MAETAAEVSEAASLFPETICYKEKFHPSQMRVIESALAKLETRKVNLVTAPGTGKMAIGWELICRKGVPALIFSPSTTEADEWKNFFEQKFLPEGEDSKAWVSRDASVKAPVISITYQALQAASNVKKPVQKWLKAAGIQLILLDDPHHLRNEWWKMLDDVKSYLPSARILTFLSSAPLDSSEGEKAKIFRMCGGIDEEISTAELLREGSVCPYQDLAYLSVPDGEAAEQIAGWEETYDGYMEYFSSDPGFASIVEANMGLDNLKNFSQPFRERPEYFMNLLACLKKNGYPLPAPMPELLGSDLTVPELTTDGTRMLVEGYLDFDKDSYRGTESYRDVLVEKLKEEGMVTKAGKCNLGHEEEIERLLAGGKSKFADILTILNAEHQALGSDMRMLILHDQIKKELVGCVGNEDKNVGDLGALPIFETIRRAAIPGVTVAAVTSTFVALPIALADELEKDIKFTRRECRNTDYVQVQFASSMVKPGTQKILDMVEDGRISVLVSANATAADGMDLKCFNSVVLTCKAGNIAAMNQIRGAAMAKDPAHPNKSLNIWHLIASDLRGCSEEKKTFLAQAESIVGIDYDSREISFGADRFAAIRGSLEPEELENWNQKMLDLSADRHGIWKNWNEAVKYCPSLSDVVDMVEVSQEVFPKTAEEQKRKKYMLISVAGIALVLLEFFVTKLLRSLVGLPVAALLYGIALFGLGLLFSQNFRGITTRFKPQERMLRMAQAVLEALQDAGQIQNDEVEIGKEILGETHIRFFLKGGTREERKSFADTLAEAYGPVTTHKCVIVEHLEDGADTYYPAPAVFDEEVDENNDFFRNLDEYYGGVILGCTETKLGRELLLKARFYSMRNPLKKTVIRSTYIPKKNG